MINSYPQKTFIVLKSNLTSKSNVKILQYKQNIWKGNYKYSIEHGIFKKWSLHCFWQLLSKMIFKKEALIHFWCWSSTIISNCWFSWLVLLLFWRLAILLFPITLFAKTVEPLSSQNTTICSLFESLHSNYKNLKSIRYKSFKFDVNSVYESKKFSSIWWSFCHMNWKR